MIPDPRLGDLVATVGDLGRAAEAGVSPDRLLDRLSEQVTDLLPHDRLVVAHLDDDGRTFTVVAERAVHGPVVHRQHYTSVVGPGERYVVREWVLRPVFAGEAMLVDDFESDARYAEANARERTLGEAGFRSGLVVPVHTAGRLVGALACLSLTRAAYGDPHRALAQQVADLLGPTIETLVLRQRERQRHQRLTALPGIARALGSSLNVHDVFDRLADSVRPVMDFDVMGVAVITTSGRDVELLVEANNDPSADTSWRLPLEDFSFAARIEAGQPLVILDAESELDRSRPGDRLILDAGGRSSLCVPFWFGERVGGCLYFGKRRPYWYETADLEFAAAIAAQVVVALQHQRLAEDGRRLSQAEGRARQLEERLQSLRSELGERFAFEAIVGRAPALRESLVRAGKVASTETTVLITGESGTGKELVARAIHEASPRAQAPFVAINCAALPETLLDSELFGHERGAFTGAERFKPGRFELAQGGTLFLDEVAELSPAVQAKLLRVLQERTFERVGGTATVRADVRLVAATNRSLEAAVERGQFREDLFYRLNVFTVHLPPLRERGDDVLLLADHFVRALAPRMGRAEAGLSREARDALLAHRWPGNIRELGNAIERALIVSEGGLITAAQLGLAGHGPPGEAPSDPMPAGTSLAAWEQQMVREALRRARGNKSRAAEILGLSRSQLYTRLKRYGLDRD